MKKIIGGILVIIGLLLSGIAIGQWLKQPTLDDLITKSNAIAQEDTVRQLQLKNTISAFQKLTLDYRGSEELNEALELQNKELADSLNASGATILSLLNVTTKLEDRLSGTDTVVETDEALTIQIDQENLYESGKISVQGTSVVEKSNPEEALTNLLVGVETRPRLIWTRNTDGTSEVTLDFGDMPIDVTSIDGMRTVDDPIRQMVRPAFPELAWKSGLGLIGIALLVLVLLK